MPRPSEYAAKTKAAVALVLDAHLKSSLAAIRSLGGKGIPVCAGSHRRTAMGLYSRYAAKTLIYPSPLEDREGFLQAVQRQANAFGKCAVFAFSDSTLLPLVDQGWLSSESLLYLMPASPLDFRTAFDKGCTGKLAETLGLEIPKTFWYVETAALDQCARKIGYPVILKPRRTVYWHGNAGIQRTASFAFSPEDLKEKFTRLLCETGEPPLLQQYVEGEEAGVEFLCQQGQPVAACAHRRLRSGSPVGGAGVVTQTVPLDYHGMGQRAERLIAKLHWSGPVMVEFKISRRTGIPHLMEINGRFWGSLPLAIAAGVDFPYLFYQLASGKPAPEPLEYRPWTISRHFWGDFTHFCSVLFRKDLMRASCYPPRLRATRDFFFSRRCCPAVFDRNDVKPAAAEAVDTVLQIAHRLRTSTIS